MHRAQAVHLGGACSDGGAGGMPGARERKQQAPFRVTYLHLDTSNGSNTRGSGGAGDGPPLMKEEEEEATAVAAAGRWCTDPALLQRGGVDIVRIVLPQVAAKPGAAARAALAEAIVHTARNSGDANSANDLEGAARLARCRAALDARNSVRGEAQRRADAGDTPLTVEAETAAELLALALCVVPRGGLARYVGGAQPQLPALAAAWRVEGEGLDALAAVLSGRNNVTVPAIDLLSIANGADGMARLVMELARVVAPTTTRAVLELPNLAGAVGVYALPSPPLAAVVAPSDFAAGHNTALAVTSYAVEGASSAALPVVTIHPPVNRTLFHPALPLPPAPLLYGQQQVAAPPSVDVLRVGCVARLEPVRGVGLLVLAIAAAAQQLDGQGARCFELVLVGAGPLRADLARLAIASGLRVHESPPPLRPAARCEVPVAELWFAGAASHSADAASTVETRGLPALLRSFDVLVNPIRQETFGLVTAEALSLRLPVLTCRSAPSAELRALARRSGWRAQWRGLPLSHAPDFERVDCSHGPAGMAAALVAASAAVSRTASASRRATSGGGDRSYLAPLAFAFEHMTVARRYEALYARLWTGPEPAGGQDEQWVPTTGHGCKPCVRLGPSRTLICACLHQIQIVD